MSKECKCDKPLLQPLTKQCGKCKMYIDRVRHIILTNQKKMSKEEYKICNSCGGKAKKTYDGWWCGWCHNEM